LYFFAGLLVVALFFSLLIRKDIKRLKQKNEKEALETSSVTPVLETVEI
jgi:hypothetical protein